MKDKSNLKTLYAVLAIVIGMFCLAFASVPLYNLFCKVTGFGGTPKIVEYESQKIGERDFEVFFNADSHLDWFFKPVQRKIKTKSGVNNLVFYEAKNISEKSLTGTATYNITPSKAGAYFSKIECFCFNRQKLAAGQKMDFPVSFYIDPAIEDDPYLKDVTQITLSYSFFEAED
ncbi:MAG: cytochrome c oxidase assembly protein [Alphaproteobacteria bacterium]|jgi:cytochrome c oxidase assembly protein subunit 11|nr:cytochrome c oxidase assembly protein [Alphaproteobacteria bacterium]MBT5828070.1 cytochrome c oxidase assembly protein [Alphaproteobacteria bacterium]